MLNAYLDCLREARRDWRAYTVRDWLSFAFVTAVVVVPLAMVAAYAVLLIRSLVR